MQYKLLEQNIGVEIFDFDFNHLIQEVIQEIINKLSQHKIIIFRRAELSENQLVRLSECLGIPVKYPFGGGSIETEIVNKKGAKSKFSQRWHVDSSYLENIPKYTLLHAKKIPKKGGETVFVDTVSAFNDLSPFIQELLKSLKIINSSDKFGISRAPYLNISLEDNLTKESFEKVISAKHNLTFEDSLTSEISIIASEEHTTRIEGLSDIESDAVLNLLKEHLNKQEHILKVSWKENDLAIWCNQKLQHRALKNYTDERVMKRIIVG